MMSPVHALLKAFGSRRCADYASLCADSGLTIAQFDDAVSRCRDYGVKLSRTPEGGYCLPRPIELLDAEAIIQALPAAGRSTLARLDIVPVIASTNQYLLEQAPISGFHVCCAEYQSAGRGRQGRRWLSPYASGLCLSVRCDMVPLPGLNLALALSVAEALESLGAQDLGIKWPNDVIWRHTHKLAGLLLEGQYCGDGRQSLVIGLGLNIALPEDAAPPPEYPWADVQQAVGAPVSRNQVAGRVLEALMAVCRRFPAQGLAGYAALWRRFDIVSGKRIVIDTETQQRRGTVLGIDAQGALLVEEEDGMHRYLNGEVSVRW